MNQKMPWCFEVFLKNETCNLQGSTHDYVKFDILLKYLTQICNDFVFSLRYVYVPLSSLRLRSFILINPISQVKNNEIFEKLNGLLTKGSLSQFYIFNYIEEGFPTLNWVTSIAEVIKYGEFIEKPDFIGYLPHFFETDLVTNTFPLLELIERAGYDELVLEFSLATYNLLDEQELWSDAVEDLVTRLGNSKSENNYIKDTLKLYKRYQNSYSRNQLFNYSIKALGRNIGDTFTILQTLTEIVGKEDMHQQSNPIVTFSPNDLHFIKSLRATQEVHIFKDTKCEGWKKLVLKKLEQTLIKKAVKFNSSLSFPILPSNFDQSSQLQLTPSDSSSSTVDIHTGNLVLDKASTLSRISKPQLPRIEHLKPLHRITTYQEVIGFFKIFQPQINSSPTPPMTAEESFRASSVSFPELYPEKAAPDKLPWSDAYDSRREIRSPIGITKTGDPLEFWLGMSQDESFAYHGLLAGEPGAGKSNTLHTIILGLAMRYSPDELEMYLLDYKEGGLEFQLYVDPERSENMSGDLSTEKALPHAKLVSIESDREFGLNVLKFMEAEIKRRGNKFGLVDTRDLPSYRKKCPQEKMPRILVVIDEYQIMFQENDQIAKELNIIFDYITRLGRAYGINLLLATQSPNVPNMNRRIYDEFIGLRIAQRMNKSTAGSVLAEGNIDAIDMLSEKPGEVIYNRKFGEKNYNEIGKVADISSEENEVERVKALRYIQAIAAERNYHRSEPVILSNGSKPAKLNQNPQFKQLSQMDHWLSLRELNKQVIQESDWSVEEAPRVTWLGESIKIGTQIKGIFRRRPGSNLLAIGRLEKTAFGILGGILLSLIHTSQPQTTAFQIIDLSQNSEDNDWGQMTLNFRQAFSQYFPITIGKRYPNQEQRILRAEEVLQNVYKELDRRKQQRQKNLEALAVEPSLFFVCAIGGLSRAQNLRPVIDNRGREELSEDGKKLLALASQGAELGIHVIIWLDSMKTWNQITADNNRSSLGSFDLRIGMNMPAEDSRTLLGENYAQNLTEVMAYFCDKAIGGDLKKFKPYAVPSEPEMEQHHTNFQKRPQQ